MTLPDRISRRRMLVKIGLYFNGIVGLILAVPIVRYLLAPVTRGRRQGSEQLVARWQVSLVLQHRPADAFTAACRKWTAGTPGDAGRRQPVQQHHREIFAGRALDSL